MIDIKLMLCIGEIPANRPPSLTPFDI